MISFVLESTELSVWAQSLVKRPRGSDCSRTHCELAAPTFCAELPSSRPQHSPHQNLQFYWTSLLSPPKVHNDFSRMSLPNKEIVLAYRHLYQHLLRAVQYSKPARYVARDHIRAAFRNSPPESYDIACISRTLEFLGGAARARGLEHKVLKNLMHVWWERQRLGTLTV